MKNYEIKTISINNGETIAYRECGQGNKNILLVHGNMSSSMHFDEVMERLEEKYKLIAVDLRGFGKSTYNKRIDSLRDLAEDINDFTDKIGLSKFSAVGWSTGGGVILELAAMAKEKIEKLVLVNSVGPKGYPMFKKDAQGQMTTELLIEREDIAKDPIQVLPVLNAIETNNRDFYKALWNVTIYNRNQPNEEKYATYIDEMLLQRNLVDVDYALVHFNITNEDNGIEKGSNIASEIDAETLVIQGKKDLVVPSYMADDHIKFIKNSTRKILDKCGHSPMTDDLDAFIESIENFI